MKHRLVASFTALSLLAGPALATTSSTTTTTHKAKASKHAKKQSMKAAPDKTTTK